MSAAQSQSPLRRWKRFLPAFAAIDDAIEAGGCNPRGEFRSVRARIVGLLRGAEDDGVAEELCAALDGVMVESLATLRVAPVAARTLASTGLAKAVVALENHESARVRSLTRDVVRGWRAAAEADLARARETKDLLDKISGEKDIRYESASSVRGCKVPVADDEDRKNRHAPGTKTCSVRSTRVELATAVKKAAPSANKSKMDAVALPTKKTPASGNNGGNCVQSEKKMEATKRKLREGYQQAEDVKRQRKIQIIAAPKMLEQRQRMIHPILQERNRARCGNSSAVRRSVLPSLQKI